MENFELKNKYFKNYYHFDDAVQPTNRNKNIFKNIVDNQLDKYKFMPFMRKELKIRKLAKIKKYEKNNKTDVIPKEEKTKTRKLTYCSHKDAIIYSIYRHILSEKYEKFLVLNEIDKNVIAYRKIKISQKSDKCKSNIHFAAEAFSTIINYTRQFNESVVLTFDISKFFDNIDHKFLHIQLCKILGVCRLTKDWSKIFHNITKFHYVCKKDIMKILKENNIEKDNKNKSFFPHIIDNNGKDSHMEYFRKFILDKKEILKKDDVGIPQGSPISDVLANLYLNEFDIVLHNLEKEYSGFYRRYCDDIIFICRNDYDALKIKDKIIEEIEKQTTDNKNGKLKIQEEKTTISHFIYNGKNVVYNNNYKNDKSLKYLGFEFNNNNILIKASSLSKRLRKIGTFIKNYINDIVFKVYKDSKKFPTFFKTQKLYRSLLYFIKNDNKNLKDGRSIKYILMAQQVFDNLHEKQLKLKYNQIKKTKKYIKLKIKKSIILCKNRFFNNYYYRQLNNENKK